MAQEFNVNELAAYYHHQWFEELQVGDKAVISTHWVYHHEDGRLDEHHDMVLVTVVKREVRVGRFSCTTFPVIRIKVKYPGGRSASVLWFEGVHLHGRYLEPLEGYDRFFLQAQESLTKTNE